MSIIKDVSVYFIACNRALCCSGLRVRVLSTSGQIQVQVAASLWTIKTFVTGAHTRGEGKESAKANLRDTFLNQHKRPTVSDGGFVYHCNIQSSRYRSVSYSYTV